MDQQHPVVDATEVLRQVKEALTKSMPGGDLQKAFTQSASPTTGLTAYSLEGPAKTFYPVLTPLRNRIRRVTGGQGTQANWRAITAINSNNVSVGVSEGNRGQVQDQVVVEYLAAFKSLGIENFVTFEADLAAQGFDDARARAVQANLRGLMIGEERVIVGGLSSYGLGTTPTPVLVQNASGGTIGAAVAHAVRVVALTLDGYRAAVAGGGVRALVIRTNNDGSSDSFGGGSARASAATTGTTGGGTTNQIVATVAPVRGAVAYAWFLGVDGTAGNMRQVAITTVNTARFNSMPAGTEPLLPADLVSNDRSANNLVHDGFFGLAGASNSGALVMSAPTGAGGVGTPLTSDGAGGIVEIDAVLQWYWDALKISPSEMWVSAQEQLSMKAKFVAGGATGTQRFVMNMTQGAMVGSNMVKGYLNPYGMDGSQEIPIKLHPDLPPGTILFLTHELPYPLSGVSEIHRILCRRDYYQLEWPLRSRRYEFGVYSDQVLQTYFPPCTAILNNIAKG